MDKNKILYSLALILVLTLSAAPSRAAENIDQRLKLIEKKVEVIESNTSNNESKEYIKQALSISSDTVKYVGIIAAIILPFLLLTIGYQIFKSYQFEKEIRETRKLMIDEYEKMIVIRRESDKLIQDTKTKMDNLENFVGTLAIDFLQKKTPGLFAEVKEQASQAIAEIKTKEEELNKSVELMKKLEKLDLTLTPTLYVERGNVYFGQKNMEKAIDNYNEAIKLESKNYEAYFKRGLTYHTMGKYRDAILDYLKVVELNSKHEHAYSNLGVCYRETDDYEKSLQNLNKAIALNPMSEFAFLQRGETYMKLGKDDLAIADFEIAAKKNPKSPDPLNRLGFFYGKKYDYVKAKEYYLKSLGINPNHATKINLSEMYICTKDYTNAEKYANDAYLDASTARDKIMSKYILITALILRNKDYKEELELLIKMIRETVDFNAGDWSFDEMNNFLEDESLQKENTDMIHKLIALLKLEIKPDDFRIS